MPPLLSSLRPTLVRRAAFAGLAVGPPCAAPRLQAAAPPDAISSVSFHEASGAAPGSPLFRRMDADATGITVPNPYDDPAMWGRRYREYMGGAMGSGLAAGDFDQDGWPDLYVSTKTKPGRLYRNLGNWKFEDVTDQAGLGAATSMLGWLKSTVSSSAPVIWHQGAVFADVNNDHQLDLYVCRNNAPNLLYVNQGGGVFREEGVARGLGVVDGSAAAAFADYDRDGWLDVLVLTNQVDGTEASGRPDRLFRNRGDGTFEETTAQSGIAGPTFGHSATWIDCDVDGWPDLYIANDFAGVDKLYRNNHDGTFTNIINSAAPHTPYSSMGADTADVDNNGLFDLFVADMATTSREKHHRGLAASRDDVLMMGTREGTAPQYMRNVLLLGAGRGIFMEAACWAGIEATDWTWSPRFEDFDNDGWQDLHVTNGMVREANNGDVLARMMRAVSDMDRINAMKNSPVLAEPNLAYHNLGGARFESVGPRWGLDETGVSFGSVTADFDRDGDLDLATINYDGGVSVFQNQVAGQHRIQVRLRGTRSNSFGVGAIVRIETPGGKQARALTVLRGYASGSELVAHFGLGAHATVQRLTIEWPSGARQQFVNPAPDRAYTIEEPATGSARDGSDRTPETIFVASPADPALPDPSLLAIPDKEQAFIPFRTDRAGPSAAAGDIDGDGRDELFLGATPGAPAQLVRWRDGRAVAEPFTPAVPSKIEDGPALFFDADRNGTLDLLVTKAGAQAPSWPAGFQARLYLNDGAGAFTPSSRLPEVAANAGAVCAADIDGDGDLDVFIGGRSIPGRYPETPRSTLLRNDPDRFTDITADCPELAEVGLVKSALFQDIDRDGAPELLVATEWGQVRCFRNADGRFVDITATAGFASGGRGWWNSIVCADFNGDGRPDFAAGNLGYNTTYEASPKAPAVLLWGDFAQNGTRLLVEAVSDGDALYPVRARTELSGRLPYILRKFPKNDDFARATLASITGQQALDAAQKFTADNFSSGMFVSQPDGTYRFEPFPSVAQIGPIQGMVAADLDGDGIADLCALQNTDAAIPRFDGGVGVFLQGRGDGTFTAVPPERSGLLVTGNGRAAVRLDPTGDGEPRLFLTRHGGTTALLEGATHGGWVKLQLVGPVGNPTGIGAEVTLTYPDGRSSTQWIGAGGGWLSQSSPTLFAARRGGSGPTVVVVRWPDGAITRDTAPPTHGTWIVRRATP